MEVEACDKPHYPYQLPEGWEWCKLEDLAYSITDGDHQAPPKVSNGIPFLVISDVTSENIDFSNTRYVSQDYYDAIQFHRKPKCGDILFTVTGSYGIVVKVSTDKQFCFQRHIGLIKPIVDNDYLVYVLRSQYVKKLCDDLSTGTAQKTVGLDTLRYFMIPIPPLQEQSRIVKSIEHWLSLVDCIEENKNNLQKAIKQAKSKILDLAIHGKLVPQDPTDEPASELLKRINPKAEIACDNGQYGKSPKGWCLCNLSSLCKIKGGKRIPRGRTFSKGRTSHIYIRVSDMKNNTIMTTDLKYIDDDVYQTIKNYTISSTDLYLTIAGTIGHVGIVPKQFDGMNLTENAAKLTSIICDKKYLLYSLLSSTAQEHFKSRFHQVAQPKLSIETASSTIVCLPPLNEQHRIVAKIEEIFTQLDNIAAAL